MRTGGAWMAIVIGLLLVGIYAHYASDPVPPSVPEVPLQRRTLEFPSATEPVPENAEAARQRDREIARLGKQALSDNAGSRRAVLDSEDLAEFVLDLLPQAQRGDGASQYLIYLALEQCRGYLQQDTDSAQLVYEQFMSTLGNIAPEERAYWQREYQRCRGFASTDWSSVADALGDEKPSAVSEIPSLWFERAVRSGHPAAVSDRALRPGAFSPEERAAMLHDVLARGDAEVYWLLFVHSGDVDEGKASVPSLAWLLIACRAGYDCTEQARWNRQFGCMQSEGACAPGLSAVERYWRSLPGAERAQAYRLAGEIEEALRLQQWDRLPLPP